MREAAALQQEARGGGGPGEAGKREGGGKAQGTGSHDLQRAGYAREVMAGCQGLAANGAYSMDECLSALDPHAVKSTTPNASLSWLDPLDFSEVFAGLETSVKVYLRDEHGRKLASCDEVRAGALWITSSGLEGIVSVCSDTESMVSVCFVSVAPGPTETVEDLEDVTIRVLVRGEDVRNSPYRVRLQPTWRARGGCVRPGVARLASSCPSVIPNLAVGRAPGDMGQEDDEEVHQDQAGEGAGGQEALWRGGGGVDAEGAVYSSATELAQNLVSMTNVCIHANYISVFPPPGGGDFGQWPRGADGRREEVVSMRFARHAWGLFHDNSMHLQFRAGEGGFAAAGRAWGMSEDTWILDDGDVGGGAGPVYLVPEGPTTHYGHTLTDSILPLFATVQLREGLGADSDAEAADAQGVGGQGGAALPGGLLERRRRRVLLWPVSGNECPVKGHTVHSRQFWALFSAVTTHPEEDVRLLAQERRVHRCYREVVFGQLIDQVAFPPRASPASSARGAPSPVPCVRM